MLSAGGGGVRESEERGSWARSVFPATTRRQYLALARSLEKYALIADTLAGVSFILLKK